MLTMIMMMASHNEIIYYEFRHGRYLMYVCVLYLWMYVFRRARGHKVLGAKISQVSDEAPA